MKNQTILTAIMALVVFSSPAFSKYSGGSGTKDDPWKIATVNDLLYLGGNSPDYGGHFSLIADINLDSYVFTKAPIAKVILNDKGVVVGYKFSGVFDGCGHSIRHLTIHTNEPNRAGIGLFAYIDSDAEVKNLNLEDVNIVSDYSSTSLGCLAGYNMGVINNCSVNGHITGGSRLGGLVGDNSKGEATNCYSECHITGNHTIGGLAGRNNEGGFIGNCSANGLIISVNNNQKDIGGLVGSNVGSMVLRCIIHDCFSSVEVISSNDGARSIGGLVGKNEGSVLNCGASGNVTLKNDPYYCGGLAGSNNGLVNSCYSRGDITGGNTSHYFGGLAGTNGDQGTITNSYTFSTIVTGINSYSIGGLVGLNSHGIIRNCYSTGPETVGSGSNSIGGFVGENYGTIGNCLWDKQTSGRQNGVGYVNGTITNLLGKTTLQMQSQLTFTSSPMFWDFFDETQNGYSDFWCMPSQTGYPILRWQIYTPYSGGTGSEDDPWQIACPNDLLFMAGHPEDYSSYFILTADINLSNYNLTKAVIAPDTDPGNDYQGMTFNGIFNGDDHVISNLTIKASSASNDYLGLFGKTYRSEIKNVRIENINISGGTNSDYVGGLVGYHEFYCTISDCYSTGSVSSGYNSKYVGGLVGYSEEGTIRNCYSTCNVYGNDFLGGLLGIASGGQLINSYSSGIVTGCNYSSYLGGLTGFNTGKIMTCYSTGAVTGGGFAEYLGGFVGYNSKVGQLIHSYSSGIVTGSNYSSYLGGLAGYNSGKIMTCYSTGAATGGGFTENLGGFVGYNNGYNNTNCLIFDCFWDMQSSGLSQGIGYNDQGRVGNFFGKTTAEMQMRTTFTGTPTLWDFVGETANGSEDIWFIREGREYPKLIWQNNRPVANAGPDQTVYAWVDGFADVTLDGSGSYDKDNDEITYSWSWIIDGSNFDANGMNPAIKLPAGVHTIQLIVTDGIEYSEPQHVVITVVPPLELAMKLSPDLINIDSKGKWVKAHFIFPEGFNIEDIDVNTPAVIVPLGIESDYLNVFINEDSLVEIEITFSRSAFCQLPINNGTVTLTVAGRLTSGQYFYGTDTIKIMNKNIDFAADLALHWLETNCKNPDWCEGLDLNHDSTVNFVDLVFFDGCCIQIINE